MPLTYKQIDYRIKEARATLDRLHKSHEAGNIDEEELNLRSREALKCVVVSGPTEKEKEDE